MGCRGSRTCREEDPAPDLEGVVRAGDVVKAEAARDDVGLAARRPQVALDDVRPNQAIALITQRPLISSRQCSKHMRRQKAPVRVGQSAAAPEVGRLAEHREREQEFCAVRAGRRVQGVVDEVGHERREAPVVAAVLEQVCDWHGRVAKSARACIGSAMTFHFVMIVRMHARLCRLTPRQGNHHARCQPFAGATCARGRSPGCAWCSGSSSTPPPLSAPGALEGCACNAYHAIGFAVVTQHRVHSPACSPGAA